MWLTNAVRNFWRKRRTDAELDEEVRGYAELLAEEKIRSGMGSAQARREAKMDLGGVEQVKEQTREVRAGHFLETLWQDLRYGARMLRKNPGFTVVAVLTLVLGIGANTAIFSIINSVLYKPLPVEAPQELVDVYNTPPKNEAILQYIPLAYPDYADYRDQTKLLTGLVAFAPTQVALEGQGDSALIPVEEISGNYFRVLHLGNPVKDRGSQWIFSMGRLKPGVSVRQAQAELQSIAARLTKTYPESNKDRDAVLLPGSQVKIFPEADKVLYATSIVLLGFAGLILLIACANVAGMLMARATGRRREIAIRTALGGGRLRLVRQLLTENLLLSLLGGAAALLITSLLNRAASQALVNINTDLPIGFGLTLDIDGRVLAFTAAVVLGTTLLFGMIPALKTSKRGLTDALKEEPGAATGARGKHRLLSTLVVAQVTIS